jgi:hypothetical protein
MDTDKQTFRDREEHTVSDAKHKQTGRRNFLKQIATLGAGGAFFAAACAASASEPPADEPAPAASQKSQGYRITPHIKTYYEKAAT